tara:strand:- start:686 stop:1978 length:1293 start_codon:yes stop_codon:yes gene_type:complete
VTQILLQFLQDPTLLTAADFVARQSQNESGGASEGAKHLRSLRWTAETDDGERAHGDDLPSLLDWMATDAGEQAQIGVVLPTELAVSLRCDVPGRTANQMQRALPYALEEYLAGEIESMHIATRKLMQGQAADCLVIEAAKLEQCISQITDLITTPTAMWPEAHLLSLLAKNANSVVLKFGPDTVLVVNSSDAALIQREHLVAVLESIEPEQVICIEGRLDELERGQLKDAIDVVQPEQSVVELLQHCAADAQAINLLQGKYQPRTQSRPQTKQLTALAAMAGVWFILGATLMAASGYWSSQQAALLEADNLTAYQSLFPSDSTPRSATQLRRRLMSKVGQRSATGEAVQGGFLDLSVATSAALTADNRITSMTYNQQRQELLIDLTLSQYEQLEMLKQKLSQTGIQLEVANAEEEGSRIRARIKTSYQS